MGLTAHVHLTGRVQAPRRSWGTAGRHTREGSRQLAGPLFNQHDMLSLGRPCLVFEIQPEPQLGAERQRLADRDEKLSPVHAAIAFD